MKLHGQARGIPDSRSSLRACPWSEIQHRRPPFIHGQARGLLVLLMKIKAGPIPLKSKLLMANKKYNQRISKHSPKFYKNCGVVFVMGKRN